MENEHYLIKEILDGVIGIFLSTGETSDKPLLRLIPVEYPTNLADAVGYVVLAKVSTPKVYGVEIVDIDLRCSVTAPLSWMQYLDITNIVRNACSQHPDLSFWMEFQSLEFKGGKGGVGRYVSERYRGAPLTVMVIGDSNHLGLNLECFKLRIDLGVTVIDLGWVDNLVSSLMWVALVSCGFKSINALAPHLKAIPELWAGVALRQFAYPKMEALRLKTLEQFKEVG